MNRLNKMVHQLLYIYFIVLYEMYYTLLQTSLSKNKKIKYIVSCVFSLVWVTNFRINFSVLVCVCVCVRIYIWNKEKHSCQFATLSFKLIQSSGEYK